MTNFKKIYKTITKKAKFEYGAVVYLYKLIPMELGYDTKIMYIAQDRADHWMYGKPMEGGKQIKHSEISYFYTYSK